MVLCKYFQQGNCRFGQYCKFEHGFGNRSKTFTDDKNIALLVAEEVLQAERGGQWLLSCYGPFKEKKCIPGMDDVSPEEIRWEMYQAQKNGTADQVNAQFQQMCEQMKAKRDALKNPTPAIFQMLEEIQNAGSDTTNKGNFAFQTSQLATSNTNQQSSSVFGQKTTFGATSNPFGSTSTFSSTQPAASIFGRSAAAPTTNVFGGKASFGGTSVFGGPSTTGSSIFGGATKPTNAAFGSVQNASTFGGLANQGSSIFGGSTTSQTAFGQPSAFGSSTQVSNPLFKSPTGQTSVFGGTSASSGNVFGGATTSTATNSVFGATAGGAATSNTQTGTSIFGQAATAAPAFGGTPVFGGTPAFGAQQSTAGSSVFGGQSTFGQASAAPTTANVFGGASTAASGFDTLAQNSNTNAFGAAPNVSPFGASASTAAPNASPFGASTAATTVAPNASPFGASAAATTVAPNASPFGASAVAATVAPNASPFGAPTSTATAGPFGAMATTANSVFATTASTAAAGPFGKPMSFGFASPSTTSTTSVFGTSTVTSTAQSPFGGSTFGGTQSSTSVFGTNTQTAQQAGNPFLTKTSNSPFGVAPSTQSSPFGNVPASSNNVFGVSMTLTIDETAYTPDESLTDDEKAIYQMSEFPVGRIPLHPPSKELA